jgi:hypothetical protein
MMMGYKAFAKPPTNKKATIIFSGPTWTLTQARRVCHRPALIVLFWVFKQPVIEKPAYIWIFMGNFMDISLIMGKYG